MLPEGWEDRTLGSLGQWSGGGTPSKAVSEFWSSGTIPWVSPKDMKSQRISSAEDYITIDAVISNSAKIYPTKSVLVVVRSGILRKELPVSLSQVKVAVNQDLKVLAPGDDYITEYVANFLWCMNDKVLQKCAKEGTTVESIDTASFKRFRIPLPPLPEQEKIADILSTWDQAIEATQALLNNAKR